MVKWIGKELGVTTLRYQKIDDMVRPSVFREKNSALLLEWRELNSPSNRTNLEFGE